MSSRGLCTDNFPDGVSAMHPYFYPPADPECLDCGMEVESDWVFCPMCGERLETPAERAERLREEAGESDYEWRAGK